MKSRWALPLSVGLLAGVALILGGLAMQPERTPLPPRKPAQPPNEEVASAVVLPRGGYSTLFIANRADTDATVTVKFDSGDVIFVAPSHQTLVVPLCHETEHELLTRRDTIIECPTGVAISARDGTEIIPLKPHTPPHQKKP